MQFPLKQKGSRHAEPEIPAGTELFGTSGVRLLLIVCSLFWGVVQNEAEEGRWGGGD